MKPEPPESVTSEPNSGSRLDVNTIVLKTPSARRRDATSKPSMSGTEASSSTNCGETLTVARTRRLPVAGAALDVEALRLQQKPYSS